MPVVRSREALSAIVTMSLTPSKEIAPPYLPAAAQVGPLVSVPLLPVPEASGAAVPLPWSKL